MPVPSSSPYDPNFHQPSSRPSSSGDENPSIFASNAVKPALGRVFPYFADLHLLMTKVAKKRTDKSRLNERRASVSGRSGFVTSVEVLADRWDARVGRWAPIQIDVGGELNSAV